MSPACAAGLWPALLLGVGILGGTLASVLTQTLGWVVMIGPLLLAAAIVGSTRVRRRLQPQATGNLAAAWIIAGCVPLACGVIAWADPTHVAGFMPILGGVAAVPLLIPQGRRDRCGDARA